MANQKAAEAAAALRERRTQADGNGAHKGILDVVDELAAPAVEPEVAGAAAPDAEVEVDASGEAETEPETEPEIEIEVVPDDPATKAELAEQITGTILDGFEHEAAEAAPAAAPDPEPVIDRLGVPDLPPAPVAPADVKRSPTPAPPRPSSTPPQAEVVDAAAVAAQVDELGESVFANVNDDDIRGHFREAFQAARRGIAVARAKGVLPVRTVSVVIAIDPDLDGAGQVFAGDRTVPVERPGR